MDYQGFETFRVSVDAAIARVTFDAPSVTAQAPRRRAVLDAAAIR